MLGSIFLLPALFAFFFSFLIVRAGAIALMLTGVDGTAARFQALSAFTGTGFTTREAETVIGHPSRRRIITWLIVLGNVGIVTVIVSATSSLVSSQGPQIPVNALLLVVGAFVVYWFATRKGLVRKWERFIEKRLVGSRTLEEARPEELLHLGEGYGLLRAIVSKDSDICGKRLSELKLPQQGVLLLGIERRRGWLPIPRPDEVIADGDRLVAYGPLDTVRNVLGST
jgi:hypothetical protein